MSQTASSGSGRLGGIGATLAAALALSLNNVTVPLVYTHGSNPPSVVMLRYVLLIVVLAGLLPALRRPVRLPARQYAHAAGAGGMSALGSVGLLGAFAFIPVSLAILIVYAYPILTAVIDSLVSRRRPSPIQLGCLFVAFVGIGIALEIDQLAFDGRGIALAVMGAIAFAASFVWNGHGLKGVDAMTSALHMSLAGLALLAVVVLGSGGLALPVDQPGWLWLLLVSSCFSLAFVGMFHGVQSIGAPTAAMLMNLEPVFTIALAVGLLGEPLTPMRMLGAALVLAAVTASQIAGDR